MNKRTEYTLLASALVVSALVGTAVGVNLPRYPSPVPPESVATVTVTPAPEVVILDATKSGAAIQHRAG